MPKLSLALILVLMPVFLFGFMEETDPSAPVEFALTNSVKIGSYYQGGHTLYKIGQTFTTADGETYSIGYDISQLKFAMNALMMRLEDRLVLNRQSALNFSLESTVPVIPNTMEDSDWGIWYLQGALWADYYTLDIFSTSSITFQEWRASAEYDYTFIDFEPLMMHSRSGIDFLYAGFKASRLDQWYPSYSTYKNYLSTTYADHYYYEPVGLTYDVYKFTVYSGFDIGFESGGFAAYAGMDLSLSLIVDIDDHLLRSKRSTSFFFPAPGFSPGARISYELAPGMTLGASAQYEYYIGTGQQVQVRYENTDEGPAGNMGSVGSKYELSLWNAGASLEIRF